MGAILGPAADGEKKAAEMAVCEAVSGPCDGRKAWQAQALGPAQRTSAVSPTNGSIMGIPQSPKLTKPTLLEASVIPLCRQMGATQV